MCGISATIARRDDPCRCNWPAKSAAWHRGPDATGALRIKTGDFSVALGMSRLKIVDQSDIAVPFRYEHLGALIAFNGEIYNWKTLRSEYSWLGPWSSNCDVEVLAAVWRARGVQGLNELNGMFSFVLVDLWSDLVIIARDRCGQKPLYYANAGGRFYASSEIKTLPVKLEDVGCASMDVLEYDVFETPFKDVCRLAPGHFILFQGERDIRNPDPRPWWRLPPAAPYEASQQEAAIDELEALILDSVRLRCTNEVPTTVQFSGGLDSVLIDAACKRLGLQPLLHCLTMDEIDHASVARASTDRPVEVTTLTKNAFFSALPHVAYYMDTPATWTAVCQWLMNEAIAAGGGKIVVSGEGADELFGGYSRYRIPYSYDAGLDPTADPLLTSYQPLIHRFAALGLVSLLDRGDTAATRQLASVWLAHFGRDLSRWRSLARTEWHTTMQLLLRMADRMASAWSLENRCPFLDHRIVELAWRLRDEWLVTPTESKSALRSIARRWSAPQSVINEKTKRGLAVPWAAWTHQHVDEPVDISSRGLWNRKGFSLLMNRMWRKVLIESHTSCSKIS